MEISDHDILVSCDVSALFTNVPVDETIGILARKAFICNKQMKLLLEYPCPSKIRDQQTSYASNLVILAER